MVEGRTRRWKGVEAAMPRVWLGPDGEGHRSGKLRTDGS